MNKGKKKKNNPTVLLTPGELTPCDKQGDNNSTSPDGDHQNVKADSCPFPSDMIISPWKGNKLLSHLTPH